jgi:simple sugar transport system permease protein
MAIAGGLAGAGGALYYLSGNTEFFWSTYQALPAIGFNGIPVALLAVNNPIAVVFTGLFMSALDIAGQQLTSLTAYNEYITNVIISVIVYLSAFSLVIKMWISGSRKHRREKAEKEAAAVETAAETGSSAVTAPASEAEAAAETQPPAAETPESPAVPAADAIDEKGDEE